MATRPTLNSLWLQLQDHRIDTPDRRIFVPPSDLGSIFTPKVIAAAVAELSCKPEDRIGLADAIQHGGLVTFAILVWIHREDAVVEFRRWSCLDHPVDEAAASRVAGGFAPTFIRTQKEFRPYFFHRGHDVEMDKSDILPFVGDLEPPIAAGGFGVISALKIHPRMQDFFPGATSPVVVVRKTLRDDTQVSEKRRKDLFDEEKRCLRLINHLSHPNIVPLLSSYVHGRDHCLIFPRLDGDLAGFFSRSAPYGNFRWTFAYFAALHGLASALEQAHDIHIRAEEDGINFQGIGYHHDLRPANVLVSSETFLLADFGMGRVKPQDDGSVTRFKAVAGDYLAPECMDEDFKTRDVGRPVDVWAFGCLLAEVITYAYLGPDGLSDFRKKRKRAGPSRNVTDSFFHDGRGAVKPEVQDWLNSLATHNNQPALDLPLLELSLSMLTPAPKRPKISLVCGRLACLDLKAHFFAVLDALAEIVGPESSVPGAGPAMKMWFERERLRAFGSVLGLSSTSLEPPLLEFARQYSQKSVKILSEIFHKLPERAKSTASIGWPSSAVGRDEMDEEPQLAGNDFADSEALFEVTVQRLIQDIWALLPVVEMHKAEREWVCSMLGKAENTEQLGNMEKDLRSQGGTSFQRAATLAMMKMIRLEMLTNPASNQKLEDLKISDTEAIQLHEHVSGRHQTGLYKGTVSVLIESMLYDPSWEAISAEERTRVMAYKATGFNPQPRPPSLRVLDCLGFFEIPKESSRPGYSFVYKIPDATETDPMVPSSDQRVVTLLQLLNFAMKQSKSDPHGSQPALGDKFRLASALASFLGEFHSTGWLHENFHSHNVVYFHVPPDVVASPPGIPMADSSGMLPHFYIVGLNKSRPGGEAWHTQGPALEADYLNYRHPAYQQTRRFRFGYDYYGLGIVLLEIGLWMPLSAIANRKENRTLSPDQLRNLLVTRYLPRLGYKMGRTYSDVVNLLLQDGLDPDPRRRDPDAEAEARVRAAFLKDVVDPLERLASGGV